MTVDKNTPLQTTKRKVHFLLFPDDQKQETNNMVENNTIYQSRLQNACFQLPLNLKSCGSKGQNITAKENSSKSIMVSKHVRQCTTCSKYRPFLLYSNMYTSPLNLHRKSNSLRLDEAARMLLKVHLPVAVEKKNRVDILIKGLNLYTDFYVWKRYWQFRLRKLRAEEEQDNL